MIALIDTAPKKDIKTVNLGLELVKAEMNADVYHWSDSVDVSKYETIAFNTYYVMHNKNIIRFLKKHDCTGKRLLTGGQGVRDWVETEIFLGEYDGDVVDKHGFHRASELISPPVIHGPRAVLEMTRGCKYRCHFCEYGCWQGGKYREKEIGLVLEQLKELKLKGVKTVNLFSVNLGGHSQIQELFDYRELILLCTGCTLKDVKNVMPFLKHRPYVRVGIETFDERTRKRLSPGKFVSDDKMLEIFDYLFQHVNYVFIYLIYGLPKDNYQAWFDWVKKLAVLRQNHTKIKSKKILFFDDVETVTYDRNIRVDFSISSLEPLPHTPLEGAPLVDFVKRQEFLKEWLPCLKEYGFRKTDTGGGRLGRGEVSYLEALRLKGVVEEHGMLKRSDAKT